jgi:hypothetical protein
MPENISLNIMISPDNELNKIVNCVFNLQK